MLPLNQHPTDIKASSTAAARTPSAATTVSCFAPTKLINTLTILASDNTGSEYKHNYFNFAVCLPYVLCLGSLTYH
jgi:hypothetical protein